jgi:hypothetical protein
MSLTSETDNELKPKKVAAAAYTEDFKKQMVEQAEAAAESLSIWKKFWEEFIPGGPRKRKRFRTPGHGKRKGINRRRNKAARAMRKTQRRKKGK